MVKLLPPSREPFPLVQAKQASLLEACGFPCAPAGERDFNGRMVPMYQATGEKRPAIADIIGFGGAAFGGKSYGTLMLARVSAELWPGAQITYFRRTYTELDGPGASMQKAYQIFTNVATDRDGGKEWHWDNTTGFYFRHCQTEKDVYAYQSQDFDILIVDEATHFTWTIIDYLLTRNRASGFVTVPGFKPFAVLPTNPGNVGHVWYSQIMDVDQKQGKHEQTKRTQNPNGKFSKVYFIPAYLEDNQIGVANDPEYETRLMERDPEIARGLRFGDWTIFAGQAFPTWMRDRVVCQPFAIPDHWPKWRALDYGLAHPWVAGWFTMNPQNKRKYIYRAIMKAGLTDTEQARLIKTSTPKDEVIAYTYASPDMWARKTAGTRVFTSVDEYKDEGVFLTRADNDRLNGKRKIDRHLMDLPDGLPGLQIFEPYYEIFRCMSTLVRDPTNPEDVLKVDGDDPYDMARYGLTNTNLPETPPPGGNQGHHPLRGVKGI